MKPWTRCFAALLIICLGGLAQAQPEDPALAQRELKKLQQRIKQLESELDKELSARGDLETSLRDAERAERQSRQALASLDTQLDTARKELESLQAAAAQRAKELREEQAELARQLRYAYVRGRDEWLRLLLSNEDPVATSRQMIYYSYISRARGDLLAAVRSSLLALQTARAAAAEQAESLKELQARQAKRAEGLAESRRERARLLASLNKKISGDQERIAAAQAEAKQLSELVAELMRALADLPINDQGEFAARRGEMEWPVQGRMRHSFGQRRADGQLKWLGALLAAAPGTEVRAVHPGRVVFANWLQGLGLLAVVDHGEGYLTLYGHNQELLKSVGAWVTAGEVLARAGDTGGQAEAGLYFEIRRRGQPIDPRPWMKK